MGSGLKKDTESDRQGNSSGLKVTMIPISEYLLCCGKIFFKFTMPQKMKDS